MKTLLTAMAVAAFLFGAVFGLLTRSAHAATLVPRRLDGLPVTKAVQNPWPVAVMIDNHTLARPQSGLQKASIVYETLAEGGIPRFMAVFVDTNVKRIGPVRSTRPYFVRYAAEWGSAMAHAGGSFDGLQAVKDYKLFSIFALKDPTAKFFYRWQGANVHNLYTDSTQLQRALKQGKLSTKKPTYQPYAYKIDGSLSKRGKDKSGAFIDLGYGTLYDVRYVYDRKNNVYQRFTGGRAQIDRLTGKQITIKNVLILVTAKEKVLDRKGRLDIKNVGTDKGVLLQNGKATAITWVKKSPRARTVFYSKDKKEIALVAGNTWITIVPRGHSYKLF
jgi:hypothetical protein